MKSTQKACVIVFVVVLFAPMIQRLTKFAPSVPLAGVFQRAPHPRFSMAGWFSGSYQKAQEDYFNEHVGFRPYFIKTYNQISFSVFDTIPGRRGTQIVVGKDNWLFEMEYIQRYSRQGRADPAGLEELVRWVRCLQDTLRERGVGFVLVVSPSKAEIYPEHIPDEYLAEVDKARIVTDYDRLAPLLDAYGICRVDAHKLFLDWKKERGYPLFAKGGIHWNHYSIYLVLQELLRAVSPLPSGQTLPIPSLASVVNRAPEGADKDIADLMNLWNSSAVEMPTPYASVAVPFRPYDERPDLLLVGDSFTFTLIDALRAANVARKVDFLYYAKKHFDYPVGDDAVDHSLVPQTPLQRGAVDWTGYIASKELVILELNEVFSGHLGWGFPEAVCRALGVTELPAR